MYLHHCWVQRLLEQRLMEMKTATAPLTLPFLPSMGEECLMIQIAQLLLLEDRAQQCMRKGWLRCVASGSGDNCNNSGALLPGASLDSVAAAAVAAAAAAGSKERPAATELLAEELEKT